MQCKEEEGLDAGIARSGKGNPHKGKSELFCSFIFFSPVNCLSIPHLKDYY
jgi:hypothetical protein